MKKSRCVRYLSALALVALAGVAQAHELFLKLDDYYLEPGAKANLKVLNGTFEKSAGPVARNRMREVIVGGVAKETSPHPGGWVDVADESHLPFTATGGGTYVSGVSTEYAVSERSADEFATYLKLEDLPDVAAKYDKTAYPKGVRYRYAKHAKAIFQIGDTPCTGFSKRLGYPVEIVPAANPATLKAGETLTFNVIYRGAPLANQLVYVGRTASPPQMLRTDANGTAQFTIDKAAVWHIHTNRMEKSDEPGFQYDSDRASLTFEVR